MTTFALIIGGFLIGWTLVGEYLERRRRQAYIARLESSFRQSIRDGTADPRTLALCERISRMGKLGKKP